MTTYRHTWPVLDDARSDADLLAEAAEELPALLEARGLRAAGHQSVRIVRAVLADVEVEALPAAGPLGYVEPWDVEHGWGGS